MSLGDSEGEVIGLLGHCLGSSDLPRLETWSICSLNQELSRNVEAGWVFARMGVRQPELELRPPEYSVESSVLGRFAAVRCPPLRGYVVVCLVRGLAGDDLAPPLLIRHAAMLPPLAWDVGMAFAMKPSRRAEAVRAVFGKRSRDFLPLSQTPPLPSLVVRVFRLFRGNAQFGQDLHRLYRRG